MPRKLAVVPPDARRAAKLTVKQAADSSERDLLIALRDRIAGDIDKGVPPAYLAPLTRQLREIARELEVMDSRDEGDDIGNAAATPDEEWAAR